jgi:hypothetical protein
MIDGDDRDLPLPHATVASKATSASTVPGDRARNHARDRGEVH